MTTVTVSDKGLVVIPATIRRGLGIKPGAELEFELHGDSILVTVRHAVSLSAIESGYGDKDWAALGNYIASAAGL